MAAPTSKQTSLVPDFPRTTQVVDKNGEIATEWKLYFEQLNQALQTIFKPEGFVMPSQTSANITLLTDSTSVANIVYDATTDEFKGNVSVAGVPTWKTFTLI